MPFPRGSEWRRWDLHIHTPFSALQNGFGSNFDSYARELFNRAAEENIAVIGVTDYFCVEGYKALRDLVADDERLTTLLGEEIAAYAREVQLLPNIEFRTDPIVQTHKDSARVNLHVIFSEKVPPEVIENHFLHDLKFHAESSPGERDALQPLTIANLRALGTTLREQQHEFAPLTPLEVGMMNAVVPHKNIQDILHAQARHFSNRYVVVVAADEDLSAIPWANQAHLSRKVIIQKSHMFFSSNAKTREFGLGHLSENREAFLAEFKTLKPCIHGSDAHRPEELFRPDLDRFFWVRADPTFDGLLYLTHEPEHRCWIGKTPPQLQHSTNSPTQYLKTLQIAALSKTGQDTWFDSTSLPLNPGLVAVIGKKGSGKSALADIIGLLGQSRTYRHFSFLTDRRFLSRGTNFGSLFQAEMSWRSDEVVTTQLDASPSNTEPERVRYLPQSYLETLCADPDKESSEAPPLTHELESVIFAHLPSDSRLGQQSLGSLKEFISEGSDKKIALTRERLAVLNRSISEHEEWLRPDHKKLLESRLKYAREVLATHDAQKPDSVAPPQEAGQSDSQVGTELAAVVMEIERLDLKMTGMRSELDQATQRRALVARLRERLQALRQEHDDFVSSNSDDAKALGIDLGKIVTMKVDTQPLDALASELDTTILASRQALEADRDGSIALQRTSASSRANELRAQLDAPSRKYQEYLHALTAWEARRKELDSDEKVADSVASIQRELADLANASSRLSTAKGERIQLSCEILELLNTLRERFEKIYAPAQEYIDSLHEVQATQSIRFAASLRWDGFADTFMSYIHKGRRGNFQGDPLGRIKAAEAIETQNVSTPSGLEAFLINIDRLLTSDDGNSRPLFTADQLIQGRSAVDLYNFIYGLQFMEPRAEITWRGISLDRLSPGERGTVLLMFYLLVDRDPRPLIIDQPEENLDNETIVESLVPAIRRAREARQIVMVTHNPNLAVVCDADQVIHAQLDKLNSNRVTYSSGSLEDPATAQRVIDVLEGTKPAFDLRDAKYQVLER